LIDKWLKVIGNNGDRFADGEVGAFTNKCRTLRGAAKSEFVLLKEARKSIARRSSRFDSASSSINGGNLISQFEFLPIHVFLADTRRTFHRTCIIYHARGALVSHPSRDTATGGTCVRPDQSGEQ